MEAFAGVFLIISGNRTMLKNIELKGMDDLETKSPPLIWLIYTFISTFFLTSFLIGKLRLVFIAGVLMGALFSRKFLKRINTLCPIYYLDTLSVLVN